MRSGKRQGMTYCKAVRKGERFLRENGIEEAGTDAWLLLSFVCGIDRNFYYMHMQTEMPEERQKRYTELLQKRAKRVPLQYITEEQEFMGFRFLVDSDVLIPRQDTEILVEEALKRIRPGMDVLDLCTGSGCIVISILKNIPEICALAADISAKALCVAEKNARLHGVSVRFLESDLFSGVQGSFDVIVSNPPYIPTKEIKKLMPEVRDFEPRLALDGKEDGLFFYRRIIEEGKKHLKPGGFLLFEIGCSQGEEVSFLMRQAGYRETVTVKDLAGLDRVVIGGNHV